MIQILTSAICIIGSLVIMLLFTDDRKVFILVAIWFVSVFAIGISIDYFIIHKGVWKP